MKIIFQAIEGETKMRKNVWILNHYATSMIEAHGGRHYWLAQEIKKKGYNPVIFGANVVHNSEKMFDLEGKISKRINVDDLKFILVKSASYQGNGMSRVKNMLSYAVNVVKVGKKYAQNNGKPDIIYASSVHPLTLLAGQKLAKYFHIPCICEVRDLWPLTLVDYGSLKEKSLVARFLYKGEKYIYKKANALIFTMAGGKQYILDRGWEKEVDLRKIFHINNGVDLDKYYENCTKFQIQDEDLNDDSTFKIIYTGSVRKANDLLVLVRVAQKLQNNPKVKILIWGSGDCVQILKDSIKNSNLTNIKYKGVVQKQYIPYILSKGDINLIHQILPKGMKKGKQINLLKYGTSQNKLFEYLASGNPILFTLDSGYNLIDEYHCGICLKKVNVQNIYNAIIELSTMSEEERCVMGDNARNLVREYDFKVLAEKLIQIIESEF